MPGWSHASAHPLSASLICYVLLTVLSFALMMASFVLGITRGFNLMEESGYLARVSFLFDRTMSKADLRGKSIMPFCMGLGCTIAGTTGARVVDYWMQRVPAIAMSWAVSYAAILSVVPAIVIAPFGSTGGFLVMVSIFLYMLDMDSLQGIRCHPCDGERAGEAHHGTAVPSQTRLQNTLYMTLQRTLDIFLRALRVISVGSIVFFVLTYGFGGNAQSSNLCRLGILIEPLTMFFGLKWQDLMAFCSSAISKESLMGVLNTLHGTSGSLVSPPSAQRHPEQPLQAYPKSCPPTSPRQRGLSSSLPSASICPASVRWLLVPERLIPSCGQQRPACSIRLCHCFLPASRITADRREQ